MFEEEVGGRRGHIKGKSREGYVKGERGETIETDKKR